jgi:energy-coupling factor transporter ATP-binding protein EcfA2
MSDQLMQGFPRELLDQPVATRRHYFETKVVAHQRIKEVYETLLHAIRYPAGTTLILVVGPTGVGKTTLLERLAKQLIEDAACDPLVTPGHLPVVSMEAPAPDSGNFSWKDYFTRALLALDDPVLAANIPYDQRGVHRDEQGNLVIDRVVSSPDLRRVLEKCLHHRRPRAFLVDEAQHLKKIASGRRLLDQMDTLKSLANLSETVHVLLGTYDLLSFMDLSAQLSRRSVEIHFPRYHADRSEDFTEFRKLLRTFQRHLPVVEEPDLQSHADYFYEQCLGCTGMVKTLLDKALGASLEQGERTVTSQQWERYAAPPVKLKRMLHDLLEEEEKINHQRDEAHRQTLREMLRLPPLQDLDEKAKEATISPPAPPVPKRPAGRRAGQRNAQRDPVGRQANHAE